VRREKLMSYGELWDGRAQLSKMTSKNVMLAKLVIALFLGSLLVGVCIGEDSVLNMASPWEPKSLDPVVYSLNIEIAEPLLDVDAEGKLSPKLAKSWDVSEDGLTWTFHLRDDVKFHDGTPFTADAAKASLERTFRKSAEYSSVKTFPIESVKAADKYTLIITTSRPFAPLAGYLSKDATDILAASSLNDKDEVIKPVGTGPFKFDSWVPKESMTGTRFDDYWGTKAKMEKVIFRCVPEEKTRESMLRAGEADIIGTLSPALSLKLAKDPDFTIYTQKEMGRVRHILFNTNKQPLDDVRVRKAISMAVDRDLICKSLLEGVDEPAAAPFSPDLYWANKNLEMPSFDPEKAKALLEEAGWTDTDNDGIREKDGKKLEIALFTYTSRPELPSIAEALKDQLGKAGIKIKITILDNTAVMEQAKGGKVDMYLVSINALLNRDPDTWASYFTPASYYYDCMNYAPEDVVSQAQKGRETMDTEKRKEIYDKLQEKILEDAPVAYLTYYSGISATRSNVHGYELSLIGEHHLENVYKE
jgi:peptide/nickel transport system substrate-binding protein